MARTENYTREQFTKAYEASTSMLALKTKLGCSSPTLYRYLRKFRLPPLSGPGQQPKETLMGDRRTRPRMPKCNPVTLANHYYTYRTTLKEVAKLRNMRLPAINRYLKLLVDEPNRFYLTKKFPPPKRICHIKIINYLIKHGKKGTNPNDLVEVLALKPAWIDEYWKHAFGLSLSDYEPATIKPVKGKS